MSLTGKVCIVTGASRGIGRGIALQLGAAGATIYITGRKLKASQGESEVGTLTATATEVESRGGKCIPVQCDHSKDEDVAALFERVKAEQNGQLDILVNNAYAAVQAISNYMGKPFWEQPLSMWDTVNNVGLRNHYICTIHAAKLMVPRKTGLIVNISSAGGLAYLFNVPYGIGKEACDRMAADCAVELRKHNVAHVSIWPGPVMTEHVDQVLKTSNNAKQIQLFEGAESVEFAGKCIVSLAKDPNLMSKSGKVLMTPELGREYDLKDVDGRVINSMRQINWLLGRNPNTAWLQRWLPNFIKMPFWMFALKGSKF
ncbi:dehydrogenase/reductase SDR family member 1-like [Crassostrea virginica]